jgi:hypothetical protein
MQEIGTIKMTFVMGGISNKSGQPRPYLQLSNGIEAKFFKTTKDFLITENSFSDLERGDRVLVDMATDGVDFVVRGIDKE